VSLHELVDSPFSRQIIVVDRVFFGMFPARQADCRERSVQSAHKQLHNEHDLVKIYFDFAEASKLIEDDISCDLDPEETHGQPSGEGCRVDA
jgi:hypothetical protein